MKIVHREQDTMRSEDSVLVQSVDLGSGQEGWRSISCLTDSTEQSAPVNFDLSNRVSGLLFRLSQISQYIIFYFICLNTG